jgi:hypothetical protein
MCVEAARGDLLPKDGLGQWFTTELATNAGMVHHTAIFSGVEHVLPRNETVTVRGERDFGEYLQCESV